MALALLLGAAKGFPEPRPCPLTAKAGPANLAEAWGWGTEGGALNGVAILSWGLGDGTPKGKDKIVWLPGSWEWEGGQQELPWNEVSLRERGFLSLPLMVPLIW